MDEIIVANIGSLIANGMAVYDSTGAQIGTVQQYDCTAGWLQTEKGGLFPSERYIPFRVIDRIGPTGISLNVTREDVTDMYERPPTVDVDVVPGPAGATVVGTVASGYDGSRVVVDSATISAAIQHLANGLKVYDAYGETVGRVYQYVPGSEWIVVEKGGLSRKDLFIPVTAVAYLDKDGVHLRVPKDVLQNTFVVKPLALAAAPAGAGAAVSSDERSRMIVDGTTINLAIARLGKGPTVYDADGKEIGRVHQYDPSTGWIVVEQGGFLPTDLFIPVTTVAYLDDDGVHLSVTKEVLQHAFVVKPINVTFVATSPARRIRRATNRALKSDTAITVNVLAELAWDPAVTVADLDVTTSKGFVTLSGTAASQSSKDAAAAAAYRVAGVRGVTNSIVVDRAAFGVRPDDAIAADVRSALTLDVRVPLDGISVEVDDGNVTLSGSVDYHYQRRAAVDDAARIAGVTGVSDLITVRASAAIAADVADNIAVAFARHAELADDDVNVTVDGDTVTLNGTVRTWREFAEAQDAACRAPGVGAVVNNLLVTY